MQEVPAIQEFFESIFPQFLADLGIDWINWITFALMLEALLLLVVVLIVRLVSQRRTITVKLTAPKLPETAEKISGETIAGLKALFISTQGALKILKTLLAKKEIDSQTFQQLSLRYKEQLIKIEEKLTEELDSVERERLRQLYDGTISPTESVSIPSSPTPPAPSSDDSAPPIPPSPLSSTHPTPPSAPPGPPSAPPSAPPMPPTVSEPKPKKPKQE